MKTKEEVEAKLKHYRNSRDGAMSTNAVEYFQGKVNALEWVLSDK